MFVIPLAQFVTRVTTIDAALVQFDPVHEQIDSELAQFDTAHVEVDRSACAVRQGGKGERDRVADGIRMPHFHPSVSSPNE